MTMGKAALIAIGLLIILMVRTAVEIKRLRHLAKEKAMIRFYTKALLIAGSSSLCVLVLLLEGMELAAVSLASIAIVALGIWKVVMMHH